MRLRTLLAAALMAAFPISALADGIDDSYAHRCATKQSGTTCANAAAYYKRVYTSTSTSDQDALCHAGVMWGATAYGAGVYNQDQDQVIIGTMILNRASTHCGEPWASDANKMLKDMP
jgi:hypothetical protein